MTANTTLLTLLLVVSATPAAAQLRPGTLIQPENGHNTLPDSGRIGVGTRNPGAQLHVRNGDILVSAGTPRLHLQPSGDGLFSYSIRATGMGDPRGPSMFVLRNELAASDALVLNASGVVTIGPELSAPAQFNFPPAALDVRAAANPSGSVGLRYAARFSNAGGTGSGVIIQAGYEFNPPRAIEVLRLAPFDGPAKFIFFNDGRTNGLSDARLKKNIQPLTGVLDRLSEVRGVTYEWSSGSAQQIGLLAQQVEPVFPQLVTEVDGHKGVDYARFGAVLLEAIHELRAEMEVLRRENGALRARLDALERRQR